MMEIPLRAPLVGGGPTSLHLTLVASGTARSPVAASVCPGHSPAADRDLKATLTSHPRERSGDSAAPSLHGGGWAQTHRGAMLGRAAVPPETLGSDGQ